MLVSVLYYSNNVCLWKEIENLERPKGKKRKITGILSHKDSNYICLYLSRPLYM